MLVYKCEPLKDPDHGAFLQQVFIRSNKVPRGAGAEDAKGSKREADTGGCVIGLTAGALGRDRPPPGWDGSRHWL